MENPITVIDLTSRVPVQGNDAYELTVSGSLQGYPKAKVIAAIEKALNSVVGKIKKEEVL